MEECPHGYHVLHLRHCVECELARERAEVERLYEERRVLLEAADRALRWIETSCRWRHSDAEEGLRAAVAFALGNKQPKKPDGEGA